MDKADILARLDLSGANMIQQPCKALTGIDAVGEDRFTLCQIPDRFSGCRGRIAIFQAIIVRVNVDLRSQPFIRRGIDSKFI